MEPLRFYWRSFQLLLWRYISGTDNCQLKKKINMQFRKGLILLEMWTFEIYSVLAMTSTVEWYNVPFSSLINTEEHLDCTDMKKCICQIMRDVPSSKLPIQFFCEVLNLFWAFNFYLDLLFLFFGFLIYFAFAICFHL